MAMQELARRVPLLAAAGVLLSSVVALAQRPPIDEKKVAYLGPDGGEIARTAIAPSDPNVVYALGNYGGISRSTDGGSTWTPITAGLPDVLAIAITVDPLHPNTVFVGTFRGGIATTTDGGATWTSRNTGLPVSAGSFPYISALAIDPQTPATMYAATSQGMFSRHAGPSDRRLPRRDHHRSDQLARGVRGRVQPVQNERRRLALEQHRRRARRNSRRERRGRPTESQRPVRRVYRWQQGFDEH
jgi:hypothetical protein